MCQSDAGAGHDDLIGGLVDDRLGGGEGSDILNGGMGRDTLITVGCAGSVRLENVIATEVDPSQHFYMG